MASRLWPGWPVGTETWSAQPDFVARLNRVAEDGGRGIGRILLEAARAEAAGRSARQLRLDCWADGDQALVRYYEHVGFTATGRVTLPHVPGGGEGTILTRRL